MDEPVVDPSEQPIPAETRCPHCGEPPTDETRVKHRLQSCGYHADDITLTCRECDGEWVCGVPIGEYDRDSSDLCCAACESRGLVHFIGVDCDHPADLAAARWTEADPDVQFRLLVKCPQCYTAWTTHREADHRPVALVGYPSITGATADADAYGWPQSDEGEE